MADAPVDPADPPEVKLAEGQEAAEAAEKDTTPELDPETRVVQRLAKASGWVPLENWHGDKADWVDADAFFGKQRADNASLRSQIRDLTRTTNKVIAQTREQVLSDARRMVREAAQTGDPDLIDKAADNLERVTATKPSTSDQPPEVADFIERNGSWFGKNKAATNYAVSRCAELEEDGLSVPEQVRRTERELKQKFPELFPKAAEPEQQRKPPPAMAGGQRQAQPSKTGKGIADVPTPARAQLEDFHKRHGIPIADLVREYFNDKEAA